MNPLRHNTIIVAGALILLLFGNIAQAYFLLKTHERNSTLINALNLLEESLYLEWQNHQLKFDSLQNQVEIKYQEQQTLKSQIKDLNEKRKLINTASNENKNRIFRLHDLDSLRR